MVERPSVVNSGPVNVGPVPAHGVARAPLAGLGRPAARFLAGLLLAIVVSLLVLAGAAVAWQQHYQGRVIPGVWVAGVPLQGLTAVQAERTLAAAWSEVGPRYLVVRDGDRRWLVPLDEMGLGWDLTATLRNVMALGHTGVPLRDWAARLEGMQRGVSVPAVWTLDEARCNMRLRRLAAEIDRPARSATLTLNGAEPRSEPAVWGRELDVDATRTRLQQMLAQGLPSELEVAVRILPPTVADAEQARERAERLLAGRLTLTFEEGGERQTWYLGREVTVKGIRPRQEVGADGLSRWVVDFDPAPVAEWLSAIASQVDRPAIEGRVYVNPDTLVPSIAVPSQTGRKVNQEEALRRVLAALDAGQTEVALPADVVKPYVTPEAVASWGTLKVISEGVSYFKGSDPGRKQNITTGSARFQGVVVPPGATFSFNQYIGPITLAEGWAEAYVIFGDRTELGAGGGICQVATTIFRAAFFGGFPIVERYPHPYRVGWYEPPVGLDATVYTPWVDVKWRNDLSFPLVVHAYPDTANGVLTFRLYGPGDLGRTVEMEGPITDKHEPAPPPIYEDDPDLEPGQVKQVDSAHDGLRARVYRIIKQGEQVIAREEFVSNYKAWPARFKRGPQPQ
ncbi:MAG: VanW family protein [Anaerolineae bacterium]